MANPAPTINQINAFNATQGTTIDFNIIGATELVRSNRNFINDLSDNSLICTHLYVSTESIHELPPNTDGSIVYESGKSSADFVNGAQYYAQIQTFTDIAGTQGGSGLSVAKMFWCLVDPTLTITTIPSTISTTSYNVSATYDANTSVVSNIIQQYQFSLYSATGSLLQSSGVVVGSGEQQGTSTAYDISYNFTGLSVGSSYYVTVEVTTTQGMSVNAQSSTFTVSIDTPTLGEATVVNNACDGYISVTSNLSSEYGGSGSGDIVSFETDSENVFTKLQVTLSPTQTGSGTASPDNVRPIYGVGGVDVDVVGKNLFDGSKVKSTATSNWECSWDNDVLTVIHKNTYSTGVPATPELKLDAGTYCFSYVSSTPCVVDIYTNGSFTKAINSGQTFTVNDGDTIAIKFVSPSAGTITYSNCQLEKGSTKTAYVPYEPPTEVSQEFDVSLTPTSTDTDPYIFKAVGDIYGDRLEENIVGGTVNWNQLVDTHKATETVNGITFTNNNDGSWTINGTASARAQMTFMTIPIVSGHKYLVVSNFSTVNANWRVIFQGDWITSSSIVNCVNTNNAISFDVASGTTLSNVKSTPKLVDLTAYFGNATIADAIYAMEQATTGSGVAFMRKYFPDVFTADYDAGTLKSVEATGHVTVGKNLIDQEILLEATGWQKNSDGEYYGASSNLNSRFASNGVLMEMPYGTEQCAVSLDIYADGSGQSIYVIFDYENSPRDAVPQNLSTTKQRLTFVSGSGKKVKDIKLSYGSGGTWHISNLQIEFGSTATAYTPYEEHTYDLGSTELRGLFKLSNGKLYADGDIRKYDGTVTRKYGVMDLGTLTWTKDSDGYFYSTISDRSNNDAMCEKYMYFGAMGWDNLKAQIPDKQFGFTTASAQKYILVHDSAYTTSTAFKTAVTGTKLQYPLATPTTETTTPFTQIQEVSKYGTLEYITANDVPVGHNTTYLTRDVFGGYIDLVSGRLVVTHTVIDGGTLNWIYWTNNSFYASITGKTATSMADVLCDIYPTADNMTTDKSIYCLLNNDFQLGAVYINDSTLSADASGATALKAKLSGHSIWYRLATPLTYQLTPQQINTLVGVNNVWSEQGDIELSYHISITNLLVKRQDVDDVSGNWLTLYSQPIEQASDMDFTFIDFLNQYGKTYKYALVPLLTQTQSGVEVEVEGGYTVSDEVQSIFDGVFISDSTGSQKCKANVGYGNVNMNQSVGSITPIGSQYPIIVTNSNNRYHNGSISGMIVPDDYYYNGNLSRIDMVNKRNELEQFLTNKRAKIIKDWNSNIWLVMIMDNIDCSFDNNYGMGIVTFNANWLEVGDPTNQEDLQATGLVDVGGV